MKVVDINFQFKGSRDYITGADIYAESIRTLKSLKTAALTGKCRLVIHNFTRRQCRLLYTVFSNTNKRPENFIAEFSFVSDTRHLIAWLVETSEIVTRRIPYLESEIMEKCILSEQGVKLKGKTGYSAIEELVAMNKLLHETQYPPGESSWIFTRLDLNRLLTKDDNGNLHVILRHNLNNRLTKSEVISNDQIIGHIYFSMV